LGEIGAEDAAHVLRQTGRLENFRITGRLDIHSITNPKTGDIDYPIRISNCVIEDYMSTVIWYRSPVEWLHCTFNQMSMHAVYFLEGLTCRDTEFLTEVEYSAGGHNSRDTPILFERVKFHKFVDFFDCWFKGPVILRDVEFVEGTNLLDWDHGWVTFEISPTLENVRGTLDARKNLVWRNESVVLTDRSPKFIYPDERNRK
jgi:hypothetical protein